MKKLLSYTPVYFLFFLISGIVLQFYWKVWEYQHLYLWLLLTILLATLFYFKVKGTKITFSIVSSFIFIVIGITAVYIQNPKNYDKYYKNYYQENNAVIVTIQKVLKPGNFYTKYIANVSQVNQQKTIGKVLLNIQKDSTQKLLTVNEQLYLRPKFKELIPPLNPHQFNYKAYLAKQHIYHQIFTDYASFKTLDKKAFSLTGISANVRNKIQEALKKHHFSKDEYAVINALLLGQRQEISKELLEDYTNAGAIHILAISGLHVGILLWILSFLLKPIERFRYGKLIKTIFIVIFLWSFAFIAGLSASVVRAVTMFSFVAIALTLNRKQHIEHSLIASMFVLLKANPLFLFDVGFQLSYLAVFGIVWVQPLLYSIWKPKFYITNKLWQLFTVSVAAQAGILPISLYYFNQFPSLFIISNLVIIPFLGGILVGGILVILLAILNLLPTFLAGIYGFIISLMNTVVDWVANQEGFLLKGISLSIPKMIAWYLFIIGTYQFIIQKKKKRFAYLFIPIILLQVVSITETYLRNNKTAFIVFHKSRNAVVGLRKGKKTIIQSNLSKEKVADQKLISAYQIHEKVSLDTVNQLNTIFKYNNNEVILIVDSLGVYNIAVKKPIIILQHSPKINLSRLINSLHPKQIVADGSNYKSYIDKWQQTCEQEKTPFHYTGKNGAFSID